MRNQVLITSMQDIGKAVRQVRKATGLTQREAAGLCNVSLPFLNGLEQGKPTAQTDKVLDVCRRFGIDICLQLPWQPEDENNA